MREIWAGEGKLRVRLCEIEAGEDLVITIGGGEVPHIGSVAVAVPRPSLRDSTMTSATASVITLVGHKDDEIAKPVSEFLAGRLRRTVVVVAGVHVDCATSEDIEILRDAAWELARELCRQKGGKC